MGAGRRSWARWRRNSARSAAAVIAGALVWLLVAVTGPVPPAQAAPGDFSVDDDAAASGEIFQLRVLESLLEGGLIDYGKTFASFPGHPGPDWFQNNLDGFWENPDDAPILQLPNLSLPLLQLLNLGDASGLGSYASAQTCDYARASSGFVLENGGIDFGAVGTAEGAENAYIDFANLWDFVGPLSPGLDALLSEFRIEFGALAADAIAEDGQFSSDYTVGDLIIDLKSPAVGGVTQLLGGAVDGLAGPALDGLIGSGGALESLAKALAGALELGIIGLSVGTLGGSSIDVNALAINGLDSFGTDLVQTLLTEPLSNADGSVTITLSDGSLHFDLAGLLVEAGYANGLNDLPPNFDVLSPAMITAIQAGITDALVGTSPNSLFSKLNAVIESALLDLEVVIDLHALLKPPVLPWPSAEGAIVIRGTLGQFLDPGSHGEPTIDTDLDVLGVNLSVLTDILADVLASVVASSGTAVLAAIAAITNGLQPALNAITATVAGTLAPVLSVLNWLVNIRINEQPTEPLFVPGNPPIDPQHGDLGPGSFTVRALSFTLLPLVFDLLKLDFASASVKGTAECEPVDIFLQKLGLNVDDEWGGMNGSSWELRSNVVTDGVDAPGDVVVRSGDTGAGGAPAWQPVPGQAGVSHLSGLEPGTYWLTETSAPDGFSLLAEPVRILVTSDGAVRLGVDQGSGGTVTAGWGRDLAHLGIDDGSPLWDSAVVQVRDVPAVQLPASGGSGLAAVWWASAALVALAAASWLLWNRRSRRETAM